MSVMHWQARSSSKFEHHHHKWQWKRLEISLTLGSMQNLGKFKHNTLISMHTSKIRLENKFKIQGHLPCLFMVMLWLSYSSSKSCRSAIFCWYRPFQGNTSSLPYVSSFTLSSWNLWFAFSCGDLEFLCEHLPRWQWEHVLMQLIRQCLLIWGIRRDYPLCLQACFPLSLHKHLQKLS